MPTALADRPAAATAQVQHYDAVIIGAGVSGLYQLYKLREELGLSVQVYETGDEVGGTWYWNRYPGARFDSESYTYGFSFSKELLQEWDWKEHFSPQPETLKYLQHVADRFDLRRNIRFNTTVERCIFDEDAREWQIETDTGEIARARFLITAVGPLSVPTMPNFPGMDAFEGPSFHTSDWPREPLDLSGKRVAVIGTGATAVQLIPEVAKVASRLTVYQRRPNWCAPLHNSEIGADTQAQIKADYDRIFAQCRETHGGFIHDADKRRAMDVSPEEREAFYEKLYGEPGFGIWMGNFRDTFVSEEANRTISEFVASKIRERVKDPAIAEKLIPTDHGFGTRRVPMETRYYEVYNQENVELVDLRETPVECVTATGIQTSDKQRPHDVIIYATGFDAVLGGFNKMEIRGEGGRTLKEKWADGPTTMLGIGVSGFPNMFTLVGPHNASSFCNIPRCSEQNVEWVTDLLRYMRDHDLTYANPTPLAEAEWTAHVHESAARMLYTKVDSWFMGINVNLEGRNKRTFLLYAAGAPAYREKCEEVAAKGYEGFVLR